LLATCLQRLPHMRHCVCAVLQGRCAAKQVLAGTTPCIGLPGAINLGAFRARVAAPCSHAPESCRGRPPATIASLGGQRRRCWAAASPPTGWMRLPPPPCAVAGVGTFQTQLALGGRRLGGRRGGLVLYLVTWFFPCSDGAWGWLGNAVCSA
jgi:hypothetical protein